MNTAFTEALAARVHELKRQRNQYLVERNQQRRRAEIWKQRYRDAIRRQAKEKRR